MPNDRDDSNVHYLSEKRTRGRALRRFRALERSLRQRLGTIVAETLDGADDALFERAEQTRLGADQNLYFTAMRELRIARPRVVENFQQLLSERFTEVLTSDAGNARRRPGKDELALMDEAAMEESVAVETLVRRVRGGNAERLAEITRELDILVAERTVQETSNPIDPLALAECFNAALASSAEDLRVRLILLKLFEQKLSAELPRLYRQVALHLARARGAAAHTERTEEPPEAAPQVPPRTDEDGDATVSMELLRRLLAVGSHGGADTGSAAAVYPPQAVLQALASLQQQTGHGAQGPTAVSPAGLRERVLNTLSDGSPSRPGTLSPDAQTAIDVVAMLFDVILDDPRLAPPIKVLISRLQIPVVRAALVDARVFQQRSHPARQLISRIARSAAGWLPGEDYERDPFYQQVSACIDRVLDAPRAEAPDFEAALSAFTEQQRADSARARAAEQRTVGRIEAQDRLDKARTAVNTAIVTTFSGRELPGAARTLVHEHWSRVLLITHLREGPDSGLWTRRVDLLGQLLTSLEPANDPNEREARLRLLPGLLQELHSGIHAVGLADERARGLVQALEPLHLAALAGAQQAPAAAPDAPPQTPYPGSRQSAGAGQPPESAPLRAAWDRLANAPVGTWLERYQEDGSAHRVKLAARLGNGHRLLFVDRSGFRAGEETLEDLARELVAGSAHLLQEGDLFDQALATVVSRLKARAQDTDHEP